MYFAYILPLLCSVLVSALPFALFGIGFAICAVWYRSDTENTEPVLRIGSRVMD
jgi:hypothetical protein